MKKSKRDKDIAGIKIVSTTDEALARAWDLGFVFAMSLTRCDGFDMDADLGIAKRCTALVEKTGKFNFCERCKPDGSR